MYSFVVPEDLSSDERDELTNIRRRKKELLDDIEVCVNIVISIWYAVLTSQKFNFRYLQLTCLTDAYQPECKY